MICGKKKKNIFGNIYDPPPPPPPALPLMPPPPLPTTPWTDSYDFLKVFESSENFRKIHNGCFCAYEIAIQSIQNTFHGRYVML